MLSIFRSNQLALSVVLVFYISIFYLGNWLTPNSLDLQLSDIALAGQLTRWLYGVLANAPILISILVGLLIWAQALMCNSLVNTFRLSKQPTFITSVAYVLMIYSFTGGSHLSPALVTNTFLLVALGEIFHAYDKKSSLGRIFNAGFWVGIASLCYWGAAIYCLLVFLGLLILRAFDWREFLVVLGGFWVPLFLMGTYQFATDNLGNWLQQDIGQHMGSPEFLLGNNLSLYSSLILWGLLILWLAANISNVRFKATMQEQKCINIVYLMLLLGVLSVVIQAKVYVQHFTILAIPMGLLLGLSLQAIQHRTRAEITHLVIFIVCLLAQYQFYWAF